MRLSQSLKGSPEAKRFIIQGDEHPTLDELVKASGPYPVSVYGMPVRDTCKEVVDGLVRRTVRRESLVMVRGPWIFARQALVDALRTVAGREAEIPDMIGLCEAAHVRVRVVPLR